MWNYVICPINSNVSYIAFLVQQVLESLENEICWLVHSSTNPPLTIAPPHVQKSIKLPETSVPNFSRQTKIILDHSWVHTSPNNPTKRQQIFGASEYCTHESWSARFRQGPTFRLWLDRWLWGFCCRVSSVWGKLMKLSSWNLIWDWTFSLHMALPKHWFTVDVIKIKNRFPSYKWIDYLPTVNQGFGKPPR